MNTIISTIRTKQEAEKLIDELELLNRSVFETGERSFESALKSQVRSWVAEIVREEIKDKDKSSFIKELIGIIRSLEELKLTLAFEPSDSSINKIHEYIKDNIEEEVILDLEYDPDILAGAIISYKGKYHDFSFLKIFDKEFEEKRAEFENLVFKQRSDWELQETRNRQ